jgi:hypothetical protein
VGVGSNPGDVGSDPRSGIVLVSEDQPPVAHKPPHNFVWQLTDHHLRLVGRYPFTGTAPIDAQPLTGSQPR